METFQFVLVTIMMISVACQSTYHDEQLRSQVKRLTEQNKRLERQNRQLSVIMSGLQQMCSALNLQSDECGGEDTKNEDQREILERDADIVLHELRSSGLQDDSVNVTAIFSTAVNTVDVYWFMLSRYHYELVRTRGINEVIEGGSKRASTVLISSLNDTYYIRFTANTERDSILIDFNLEALKEEGNQDITIKLTKYPLKDSYVAHSDKDMTFNITIKQDARNMRNDAVEAYFSGLNTTIEPTTSFEIMSRQSLDDGLIVKGIPTGNETINLFNVTLENEYARGGGFLDIQILEDEDSGFYEKFIYNQKIHILNPVNHEVLRSNSFGLYPLDNQTFIVNEQSLFCAALGNPSPTVQLLRLHRNKEVQIPTETLVRDQYANFLSAKLSSQEKGVKGTYICRASNANKTIETQTEVVAVEKVVFDEQKTGVMKNTTKRITVSCKAAGVPRPKLEIRLFDMYGPDLIKSRLYKVKRTEIGKNGSRVVLSLSPTEDKDIFRVFCAASQVGVYTTDVQREVNIFPEQDRNWQLHEKISNLAYENRNEDVLM